MMSITPFVSRQGTRLRLFLGEADEWQGQPLWQVVFQQAHRHGAQCVTVRRGIEGFGPAHHLSSDRLPDIAENLPLIVEIVDSNEQIERLLPVLDRVMQRGMITATPVEIIAAREREDA
jgi:uncharacterized protein